jgi:hypothetical protein
MLENKNSKWRYKFPPHLNQFPPLKVRISSLPVRTLFLIAAIEDHILYKVSDSKLF